MPLRGSTPGPNAYSRNDDFGRTSVSIGFTKELRLKSKPELRPGPLDYNVDFAKTQKSTPKFTIGHEIRPVSQPGTKRPITPSSQSYSPNHSALLLQAPRATFDKQKRPMLDSNSESPGPGSYDTSKEVTDGPKVRFEKTDLLYSTTWESNRARSCSPECRHQALVFMTQAR